MNWLDRMHNHVRFYVNSGLAVEPDYKEHRDTKSGARILKVDGQRNTNDEIQSYRESCDINVILKRYQNGDFAVLDKSRGQFLDTYGLPDNFAEWLELSESAKRFFYSLDPDVRAKYNNSYEQFLNAEVKPEPATEPEKKVEVDANAES